MEHMWLPKCLGLANLVAVTGLLAGIGTAAAGGDVNIFFEVVVDPEARDLRPA